MFYLRVNRVEKIMFFLYALNLCILVMGIEDLKDDNIDRGSRSDRGGLWFGPRLGKRSLRLVNDDNRQTFLRLLEAADALRYYYDQLSYESQADDPEMKVTKKVIFTPKLGRSIDAYAPVDFTPRLGRRLADDRVTPADQDNYRPEVEQMDRNKYFSPRLGRTMNFSPRLGRELSYDLYPDKVRVVRSVNKTGYIGLIVSITSGHLIIAADIEEFKQFAKKVVPGNFVEKLFEIVSQKKAKNKDNKNNAHEFDDAEFKEDNIYSYEYEEEENPEDSWQFVQYPNKAVIRQGNLPDSEAIYDETKDSNQPAGYNLQRAKPAEVNVDDLVEKVRQRLLHDFQKSPPDLQKFLGANVVTPDFKDESNQRKNTENRTLLRDSVDEKQNQRNSHERKENPRPNSSKIERKDAQSLRFQEDDLPEIDAEGNVRVPKDQRQKKNQDFIFEELNLDSKKKEKDTYEDYVTPKREENIFVSEETMATTKQARSSPRWSQRSKQTKWQDIFNYKLQNGIQVSSQALKQNPKVSGSSTGPYIYDDSNETTTALDLKARTENLWFDYKDERNPKMLRMDTEAFSEGKSKKVKHATMIPTRETYKMTSPNYYGQMPTVAEKYNFDEPIPEKDREIENLKPIGNPPANINGRIRV